MTFSDNLHVQACPLFPLKDSLELMLRRPAIVNNLSYDNVPDCEAFKQV
jgi:hypothetical protein